MWVPKPEEEQDSSSQGSQSVGAGAGSGAPLGSGNGSSTVSNPSTLNPVAPTPQPKTANIQDYLSANKEQGNALGQQFQSGLTTTGTKDKSAIDTSVAKTKDQAAAGTTGYDSGLVNKALSDPTSVAKDPNQLQSFLSQWNASYSGPSSFETSANYDTANKAATDAKDTGALATDTGGRKQILGDNFGVQGQGNKNLDQSLVQHADNFGDTLDTGNKLTSLGDYFAQQSADTDAATKAAADTTAATQTQTRNAFDGAGTKFQNDLAVKTKAAQDAVQANISPLQADLKSGDSAKLSADLDKLNVPAAQKASIIDYLQSLNKDYGVNSDVSNYYTFNPLTDVNAANVASKDDYAKADALSKLTGQDTSGILNQNDAAKAGTYDSSANALDAKGLDSALRQRAVQAEMDKLNAPAAGGSSAQPKGENLSDYIKKAAGPIGAIANPVMTGTTLGVGKALSGIANSVNKAFGGGGKKDAVVSLPQMDMPAVTTPTIANAAGTKAIVDLLNKPINSEGSYHEGAVYDAVDRIEKLRSLMQDGQLTREEFDGYAKPLATWAKQASQTIMGASSQASNSVSPAYNHLMSQFSGLLK